MQRQSVESIMYSLVMNMPFMWVFVVSASLDIGMACSFILEVASS